MEDSDMKDTILESQRLEEIDRVVLDNINTTYVAFTRPVERLDVILELGKLNYDEVKTMPQIILESIKKMTGMDAVTGNQTTDFSPPEKEELKPSTAKVLYPEKLFTGSKISQLVIVPKGETASSQPDRMNPREMGSEVHRLLEQLISARESQFGLRIKHKTGQLNETSELVKAKKKIALIKTVMNEVKLKDEV